MMEATGVLRLGQERFAAGLFWQLAPSVGAARREAKLVATKAETAADLYCIRRHGVLQYGLGLSAAGHRPGMRAIAAVLAAGQGRASWIAVFAVDRRWLLVMVRDGAVLPDGDLLFADEQEVRTRFDSETASGKWERRYRPSTWDTPETVVADLNAMVGRESDSRLCRVHVAPARSLSIAVAAALAGAAIVWRLNPAAPVPEVPALPPPPPPPWFGEPAPEALIALCAALIGAIDRLPGYDLELAVCDRDTVDAGYVRRYGSLAWLPPGLAVRTADRAQRRRPIPTALPPRLPDPDLWSADDLRRHVWGAAQTLSLDSEISEAGAKIGAAGRRPRPLTGMRELSITLAGPLGPSIYASILGPIPGFVVDEVRWSAARWTIKGTAYAR